jgi:ADP-ribose pyrophosphatase
VLCQGKFITMFDDNGWEYVTRPGTTGIVVIVAVTDDQKLVLVEQYRKPVRNTVVEMPAGMVGDEVGRGGESLLDAAYRELEEETGFAAREIVFLAEGPTAVGLSDEVISFFQARGLTRVGPGGGDASENITVREIPLAEVRSFLAARQAEGLDVDPKIYAGLFLAGVKI